MEHGMIAHQNEKIYKDALKTIATILGLDELKHPDGSKVKVTSNGVVEAVKKIVAERKRTFPQSVETSSPHDDKRQKLEQDATINTSDINNEVKEFIEGLGEFPLECKVKKMKAFEGDAEKEVLVTVGYDSSKKKFSTLCVPKCVLLDPKCSLLKFKLNIKTYNLDFVADQIGDMSSIRYKRLKLNFWDTFGGEPRDLEYNFVHYNAVWMPVKVFDFIKRNSKFPVVLKIIGNPPPGINRTYFATFDMSCFRECQRE